MNRTSNADIETDHDVKLLVGHFYSRIREDEVLGFMFDGIANVDWSAHIPVMCEFWETVLFARPGYKGNPLLPHMKLDQHMKENHGAGIKPGDFERWIRLFHTTVDAMFAGPRADHAKRAAARMAEHMMTMLATKTDLAIVTTRQTGAPQLGYHFS